MGSQPAVARQVLTHERARQAENAQLKVAFDRPRALRAAVSGSRPAGSQHFTALPGTPMTRETSRTSGVIPVQP